MRLRLSTPRLTCGVGGAWQPCENNHEFRSGATLLSQLSYQNLDSDVKPLSSGPARIGLERASGGFFNRQSRSTIRRKWSELYRFAPLDTIGHHQLKTGFQLGAESYHGDQIFRPVTWLGVEDQSVLQLDFTPPAGVRASKNDYALFLQDKWEVAAPLTLDLGLRLERDSIAGQANPSYRAGLRVCDREGREDAAAGRRRPLLRPNQSHSAHVPATSPTHRDAIRPGWARSRPSVAFESRVDGPIRNARSLSWSLQLDREAISRSVSSAPGITKGETKRNSACRT